MTSATDASFSRVAFSLRSGHLVTVGTFGQTSVEESAPSLVLIIDDAEDNRRMYRMILEHAGYRVEVANDADSGLACARELRPAVVIMDLAMPGLDGWEATRMLKSDPATSAIGVIALSAFHEPPSRQRARAAGADFFVATPCLPAELALHVSECIRRRRST